MLARFCLLVVGLGMIGLGTLCLAGCSAESAAKEQQLAALGAQFRLAEEPTGAISVLEFRESGQTECDDLVLLGRIGGGKACVSATSAEFLMRDPAHDIAAGDDHECHSENCPFCKNKQSADHSLAIVMLTQQNDQVPAVGAGRLLQLAEGQMVVVRGRAEINAIGQLVVRANGVYVRQ
jgi:hypothetical protein